MRHGPHTHAIVIHEVVRHGHFELGPDVPVLRVPYDAFRPSGPARRRGDLVDWVERGVAKTGRVATARLGETHAGERVLVQVYDGPADAWWLCEVQSVDGDEASS